MNYTTIEAPAAFKFRMPTSCDVMVYASDEEPGTWIVACHVEALDVETGETGYFSTKLRYHARPTTEHVLLVTKNMLQHEIAEQLGLDPHDPARPL